jgi:hypothetical protein
MSTRPTTGRWISWSVVALAGLAILAPSACTRRSALQDQAPEVQVTHDLVPGTPVVGDSLVQLSFRAEDGSPQSITHLKLRGDMTHPGMVPWITDVDVAGASQVEIPVKWTMAGDWIIRLEAELEDGRRLVRTLPVAVQPATGP